MVKERLGHTKKYLEGSRIREREIKMGKNNIEGGGGDVIITPFMYNGHTVQTQH